MVNADKSKDFSSHVMCKEKVAEKVNFHVKTLGRRYAQKQMLDFKVTTDTALALPNFPPTI